jgi:hypothetical protein
MNFVFFLRKLCIARDLNLPEVELELSDDFLPTLWWLPVQSLGTNPFDLVEFPSNFWRSPVSVSCARSQFVILCSSQALVPSLVKTCVCSCRPEPAPSLCLQLGVAVSSPRRSSLVSGWPCSASKHQAVLIQEPVHAQHQEQEQQFTLIGFSAAVGFC